MSAGAIDPFSRKQNLVRWSRVVPDKPGGLHRPKLEGDVGWDLEAMEDRTIAPMESCDVPVNLRLWLPPGWYADVRNRSSMARRGLYVDQNLVDNGYRGPMFVFIRNMAMPFDGAYTVEDGDPNTVTIRAGERVGQLVFHKVAVAWSEEVEEVPESERGERGFGSTGL